MSVRQSRLSSCRARLTQREPHGRLVTTAHSHAGRHPCGSSSAKCAVDRSPWARVAVRPSKVRAQKQCVAGWPRRGHIQKNSRGPHKRLHAAIISRTRAVFVARDRACGSARVADRVARTSTHVRQRTGTVKSLEALRTTRVADTSPDVAAIENAEPRRTDCDDSESSYLLNCATRHLFITTLLVVLCRRRHRPHRKALPPRRTGTEELDTICANCKRICIGAEHHAYEVLHLNDPAEVELRRKAATAEMLESMGRAARRDSAMATRDQLIATADYDAPQIATRSLRCSSHPIIVSKNASISARSSIAALARQRACIRRRNVVNGNPDGTTPRVVLIAIQLRDTPPCSDDARAARQLHQRQHGPFRSCARRRRKLDDSASRRDENLQRPALVCGRFGEATRA